jgi:hypothetical protein
MGSRDRPHREQKKKPKDKAAGLPKIQPLTEPPASVEVIKPKRKPRWDEEAAEDG